MSSKKFKVIVVGPYPGGKTTLINTFLDGSFNNKQNQATSVNFYCREMKVKNNNVEFNIWDTSGIECFFPIIKTFFRGAHGALLVLDLTNPMSFDKLDIWLSLVRECCDAYVLLVGNKCDLETQRVVSREEIDRYAERNGLAYIETSATNNVNVYEAFEKLTREMLHRMNDASPHTISLLQRRSIPGVSRC